ncbi:MAG: hypothetical protein HYX77_01520 [Acidobacteria bacterium]|nr:hypothetical protein [Acidobacteriota bacterium]
MPAEVSSAPPRAIDEIIERCLNGDQAAWNEATLCTAVMLRDIRQELSYRKITDRLGLPEGAVKSRINRGRTGIGLGRQLQDVRERLDASPSTGVRG